MSKWTLWTLASLADARALASQTGRRVVFVADAVNGFVRPLADGETAEQAAADFERAGEPAVRVEEVDP